MKNIIVALFVTIFTTTAYAADLTIEMLNKDA
jgi:hypothetical protein